MLGMLGMLDIGDIGLTLRCVVSKRYNDDMTGRRLRVELHSHTTYSFDGFMEFDGMVETRRRRVSDTIAITDHDNFEGAEEFHQRAERANGPVQIIRGEERTLNDGSHLLGLFLQKEIHSSTAEEMLEEVAEQGGFCLIPHPFRTKDGLFRNGLELLPKLTGRTIGFELQNAKCSYAENLKARTLLESDLAPFGGSDAHYESDLGECLNLIPFDTDLKTSIARMIQRASPYVVLGQAQTERDSGRAYAAAYHKVKKFARLPRTLLPLAKQSYRWYRNHIRQATAPVLVEVYRHE